MNMINKKAGMAETAASVPALLLCFVTFMMLMLDILLPGMSRIQYAVYPVAIRIASLVSIVCMAACFSSDMAENKLWISMEDAFFLLFAICMITSTIVNGITHDAIFGVPYRYVGLYDFLLFIFVYRYCAGKIISQKQKYSFLTAFISVADMLALVFLYDRFTGSIKAFGNKAEPAGIFFHGNHYGYFLVMAIIVSAGFLLYEKNRRFILGTVSFALNIVALMFNRSMGSIVAVCFVLIIMMIASVIRGGDERKKAMILLSFSAVAALASILMLGSLRNDVLQMLIEIKEIISGNNDIYAGNGRWGIWQYTSALISDSPLWGYGCEGINEALRDYALTSNPHNEPLTYAAFFGIPASAFYCLAVIISIIKGLRSNSSYMVHSIAAFAALGYFVSSFFGVAVFYTAPFLFVFLGLSISNKDV